MSRGETDIDAAATLLGFRTSFANAAAFDAANQEARGDAVFAVTTALPQVVAKPPQPQPKKPVAAKFPARLMEMLSDESNGGCITWLPHGRSFLIHDVYKFTDTVLPKYFKGTKFSSFTRKLYRWGFRQVSAATGKFSKRGETNSICTRDKQFLFISLT